MEEKDFARIEVSDLCKSYNCNGEIIQVLKHVSFKIDEGERIGIVGRNGAGKSTLLKIIAGYSRADFGQISVNRNINALLDLGTTLNGEMTGEENVRGIGELMGVSGQKVTAFMKQIEEFVDLGDYWKMPVKTYSSGMKARIAFAQCAFIEPEILIIDEVLGVGDAEFVKKSTAKVMELCDKGRILLFVSHSASAIRNMTTRSIWLDSGEVRMDGSTEEVMNAYEAFIEEQENKDLLKERQRWKSIKSNSLSGFISLMLKKGGNEVNKLITRESAEIVSVIKLDDLKYQYKLRLILKNIKGTVFFDEQIIISTCEIGHKMEVSAELESINYTENTYFLEGYLYRGEESEAVDMMQKQFTIKDPYKEYYSFPMGYMNSKWAISDNGGTIKNEHIWSNSSNVENI